MVSGLTVPPTIYSVVTKYHDHHLRIICHGQPVATTGQLAAGMPSCHIAEYQALRMNLFILFRILLQYLKRLDKAVLSLAKEVSMGLQKDPD